MSIFIVKGDKPLSDGQLAKRTQAHIEREYPAWKRERSIRKNDDAFNVFMQGVATDTDTNRTNNLFNIQLSDYRVATARLEAYVLADGRVELTEMQDTTEYVVDAEGMLVLTDGEPTFIQEEVIVQTAIEPLEATVEITTYPDDIDAEPVTTIIENPEITQDNLERLEAQAVIDATPQEIK